jgi:hypothetical protein
LHAEEHVAIFIAGMHRSNSSILSLMLGGCGVDLGPPSEDFPPHAEDNPDGYGENVPTTRMNDAVLKALGGAWDDPPQPPVDWNAHPRLRTVRKRAQALVQRRAAQEPWGWKDPRNCLTLPFWRSVACIDKIVIPVRHPLEVAASLQVARGIAVAEGLRLWEIYNLRITESTNREERLICHADSLCRDPESELRRVVRFLGLRIAPDQVSVACHVFRNDLRRHHYSVRFTDDPRLSPGLAEFYNRLCAEAGVGQ